MSIGSGVPHGMTQAELDALPTIVSLTVANRALGLGRTVGYALARRGQYPCRVTKVGGSYKVVTADLRRILGVDGVDGAMAA